MRKYIIKTVAFCMIALATASCSQNNSFNEKSVNHYKEMVVSGKSLTQEDYAAMTDIMEDAYKQIIPDTKEVLSLSLKAGANNKEAVEKLQKKAEEVDKKYSDLNPIMECLLRATPEQMGEETYKRFQKLVEDGQKDVEEYTKELMGGQKK